MTDKKLYDIIKDGEMLSLQELDEYEATNFIAAGYTLEEVVEEVPEYAPCGAISYADCETCKAHNYRGGCPF